MIRFYHSGALSPSFKEYHIKLTYDFLNHEAIKQENGLKDLLNYYCIYDLFDYDLYVCKMTSQYNDYSESNLRFDERVGLSHKYNIDGMLSYKLKKSHNDYINGLIEVISPNIIKCLYSGELLACKIIDGNVTWNTVKCKTITVNVYIDENGEVYD